MYASPDVYQRLIQENPYIGGHLSQVSKSARAGFTRDMKEICERPISPNEIDTYLRDERPQWIGFLSWAYRHVNINDTSVYGISFPYEYVGIIILERLDVDMSDEYAGFNIIFNNPPHDLHSPNDVTEYSLQNIYSTEDFFIPDAMTMSKILARRISCKPQELSLDFYAKQSTLLTMSNLRKVLSRKVYKLYLSLCYNVDVRKDPVNIFLDTKALNKHEGQLMDYFRQPLNKFFTENGIAMITPYDQGRKLELEIHIDEEEKERERLTAAKGRLYVPTYPGQPYSGGYFPIGW